MTIPSLKELCLQKVSNFPLEELTSRIKASTARFQYPTPNSLKGYKVENQAAKMALMRPKNLPKLLIQKNFVGKIEFANQQKLGQFLEVFKRKFCGNNSKEYTRTVNYLTSYNMGLYASRSFEWLKFLIKTGVDPNAPISTPISTITNGKGPLLYQAILNLYPADALKWLINNGSCCSEKNKAGNLPLFTLLTNCFCYEPKSTVELLNLFVQNGASFSASNSEGKLPLEFAYELSFKHNSPSLLAAIQEMLKHLGWQDRPHNPRPLGFPLPYQTMIEALQYDYWPSGYRALPRGRAFEDTLIDEKLLKRKITVFEGTDVEIVINKNGHKLQLHQVTPTQAARCQTIFDMIKDGKTCFQWQNSPPFAEQVLGCFKKLLTRPSGRALILLLARADRPLFIIENLGEDGSFKFAIHPQLPELISVDFTHPYSVYCLNRGVKELHEGKNYLLFSHELLHAHLKAMGSGAAEKLIKIKTLQPNWSNLNEQFVIAGLRGKTVLCENMIRFEFGELERDGHVGAH